MKLLASAKIKTTKDENGENENYWSGISPLLFRYQWFVNMIEESYIQLFLLNRLINY